MKKTHKKCIHTFGSFLNNQRESNVDLKTFYALSLLYIEINYCSVQMWQELLRRHYYHEVFILYGHIQSCHFT